MRGGRRRKLKSEINVVPYIDVMLVLLIIFMAVPPSQNPSVINLPNAEKSALPPDDYIQVRSSRTASLSIGIAGKTARTARGRARPPPPCRAPARPARPSIPTIPVLIAGDRDSKYDDVIQLISEAKKMGINRVGLATK